MENSVEPKAFQLPLELAAKAQEVMNEELDEDDDEPLAL